MKLRLLVLSFLIGGLIGGLYANNNPVVVYKWKDEAIVPVVMNLEIGGPINLFSVVTEVREYMAVSPTKTKEIIVEKTKKYYISKDSIVESITPGNFKQLAKEYFKDLPEIYNRIGKRGFRFENLPFMILFYNKKIIKGTPLTKDDVKSLGVL